jgi:hypothetical protein
MPECELESALSRHCPSGPMKDWIQIRTRDNAAASTYLPSANAITAAHFSKTTAINYNPKGDRTGIPYVRIADE